MGGPGSTISVVIIDDDSDFRYVTRRKLEEEGLRVAADVPNAETAIFALKTHKPDIVMMDLFLWGGQSSSETVKRIQAAAPGAHVVLVSASPARDDVLRSMKELGIDTFIPKSDIADAIPTFRDLKAGKPK